MKDSRFHRLIAGASLAAALALPAADADAVVYSSAFDPPNFSGIATFDVADACLTTDGFHTNGVGGCTVTWLTATVTFQDAPGHTFSYHPALLPDSGIVFEIFVAGGDLAGVRSGALGPAIVSGQSNPAFNGPWWIQYEFADSSDDLAVALDGPPSSGSFGLGVVYLYGGECFGPPEPFCARDSDPAETANVETFTRLTPVPEPGSLALALTAVAGAWYARRRNRAA